MKWQEIHELVCAHKKLFWYGVLPKKDFEEIQHLKSKFFKIRETKFLVPKKCVCTDY